MKVWFLWMIVALLLCIACHAPQRRTDLVLGYRLDNRLLHASGEELALAVETRADLSVYEPRSLSGGGSTVRAEDVDAAVVHRAFVEDESVARVLSVEQTQIAVAALRPGTTTLTAVTAGGTVLVRLVVAEPHRVELTHWTWAQASGGAVQEDPPLFLAGGTARFHVERRDGGGHRLGGYGAPLPIYIDPPTAGRLSYPDRDSEHVDIHFTATGFAALRPQGGRAVPVEVVPAGDVRAVDLLAIDMTGDDYPLRQIDLGRTRTVAMWLTTSSGLPVFGSMPEARLESRTPATCVTEPLERWLADGVFSVGGLAPGECVLAARFGEREQAVRVTVQEPAVSASASATPL